MLIPILLACSLAEEFVAHLLPVHLPVHLLPVHLLPVLLLALSSVLPVIQIQLVQAVKFMSALLVLLLAVEVFQVA